MMKSNHKQQPSGDSTSVEGLPEKLKLSEARQYLNISFSKMTSLITSGMLAWEPDPFDNRVKLVKRADLDHLKSKRGMGVATR
jgi:hypothetical protein